MDLKPATLARRAAALLVPVLIFVALDVGTAQICKEYCSGVFDRGHRQKFRVKHPAYHHTFAANVSVFEEWGGRHYPLFTNSLGFRDSRPREIELRTDRPRILVIGDSFVEGQGVTWDESVVGRLEAMAEFGGAEFLNAAVSSYAPHVFYAKIRHLIEEVGLEFDHVLAFIDMSDIENSANWYRLTPDGRAVTRGQETKRRQVYGTGLSATLKANSLTVAFVYQLRDWIQFTLKKWRASEKQGQESEFVDRALWRQRVLDVSETAWCVGDLPDDHWSGLGLAEARQAMTLLHALLEERGIGLTIVVYPWPANIIAGAAGSRCRTAWDGWARDRGVDLVKLFAEFDSGDPWETVERYFIPYDVHWNAAGNAKVADAVAAYMKNAGLAR